MLGTARSGDGVHQKGSLVDAIESSLLKKVGAMFGGEPKLGDSLMMIGVDSVGMAELTFDIEKEFGIRVDGLDFRMQGCRVDRFAEDLRSKYRVRFGEVDDDLRGSGGL